MWIHNHTVLRFSTLGEGSYNATLGVGGEVLGGFNGTAGAGGCDTAAVTGPGAAVPEEAALAAWWRPGRLGLSSLSDAPNKFILQNDFFFFLIKAVTQNVFLYESLA